MPTTAETLDAAEPAIAWGTIGACVLSAGLGVAIGLALLLGVILPALGYGYADRIVNIGERLDGPSFADRPTAVFLGSSVVVEGIDAREVVEAAPGWVAFNFSINGCEINEQRVMLPKVLAAKPRAVVLLIRPITIAMPGDIPPDKAYGYVLGGFAEAWKSQAPSPADPPLVSEETMNRLAAGPLEARLHFRRVLIQEMNQLVRLRLRGGLRSVPPDEFDVPNNMTNKISGTTLDHHVEAIIDENVERMADLPQPVGAELWWAVQEIAAAGAVPVLIMAPQHPRVQPTLEEWSNQLEKLVGNYVRLTGGVYADARDLVGAEGFADALHLGEDGRQTLSRFVGEQLQSLSTPEP
jgi:hypothetical protein